MFLQLAEGENNGNYKALAENNALDNYIYVPANFLPEFPNDTYVRADYFSNNYDTATADMLVNKLASMQVTGMSVVGTAVASAGIALAKKLIEQRKQKVASGEKQPLFKAGGLLDRAKQKLLNIKNAQMNQTKDMPTEPIGANIQLPSGSVNVGFQPSEQAQPNFFQKNKTALLIGGGALVLIGGIYLITRKKRK